MIMKKRHVPKSKFDESERKLNAIGRPYNTSFNPDYRMKYQRDVIKDLCKPMPVDTQYVGGK